MFFCNCRQPRNPNLKNLDILILGTQNSGKTKLVTHLSSKPGHPNNTDFTSYRPSFGFSNTTVKLDKKTMVNFWDVGGSLSIRGIWKNYYAEAHGFIYVVDGNSSIEALDESVEEFKKFMMEDCVKRKPVLILINKSDLKNTQTTIQQISQKFATQTTTAILSSSIHKITQTTIQQISQKFATQTTTTILPSSILTESQSSTLPPVPPPKKHRHFKKVYPTIETPHPSTPPLKSGIDWLLGLIRFQIRHQGLAERRRFDMQCLEEEYARLREAQRLRVEMWRLEDNIVKGGLIGVEIADVDLVDGFKEDNGISNDDTNNDNRKLQNDTNNDNTKLSNKDNESLNDDTNNNNTKLPNDAEYNNQLQLEVEYTPQLIIISQDSLIPTLAKEEKKDAVHHPQSLSGLDRPDETTEDQKDEEDILSFIKKSR